MPRARGAYAGIIYVGQRSQSGGRGSLDSSSTEPLVDDMMDQDEDLAIPPTPSDHGSPTPPDPIAPTAPMTSSLSSPNRIEVYILVDRVASDNKELPTILREIHETKLHDKGWAYREIPDDHRKTWWPAFLRRRLEEVEKSNKARANRLSEPEGPGTGIIKHRGGSKPAHRLARELAAKTGKEPTNYDILLNYHQNLDGSFTDSRAKRIADEYQFTLSQRLVDCDSDQGTVIDPNEVYLDVVGTTKGRRYGLGCFGRKVRSRSECSSQESVRYTELQDKLSQQQELIERMQEAQSERERMFGEMLQQSVAAAVAAAMAQQLESNLHRRALSARWDKRVNSVANVGSASHTSGSTKRVSLNRARKRKCPKNDIKKSSEAETGPSFLFWRGRRRRKARWLFHRKVVTRSLAVKAARQGGCRVIAGVHYYPDTAWRAAVEQSTSVEQLALQGVVCNLKENWVRELDASIRWDEIGNSDFPEKTNKKSKKNNESFKKAEICDRTFQGEVAFYLLDFGKTTPIPDIVVQHGNAADDSSSKYWLDELHVPLHLLMAFKNNRIVRESKETVRKKARVSCRMTKKPLRKKGFEYLFSKANRLESQCNEDILIGEAKPESSNRKKPPKELKTSRPENKERSKEKTKAPLADLPRRSSRNTERFSMLMQCLKTKTRKRRKQETEPEEDDFNHIRRKKRKHVINSSYWLNGVHLSRRTNDERLMRFRSQMLLVLSGESTSIEPKCSLCGERDYTSNLDYVACEICRVWFHADALGVGDDKIGNIIRFKCHVCLKKKRTPICPRRCCPTGSNGSALRESEDSAC
ncbi:hypothetical protein CASFOL_035296 [Castilleja foliolosa]|uniref:Membrane-bound transcription factor PTM chromo domain-containing protein n=1 Tax=Castilleja foliolosa TaxID=1961234 RepID=A0ABD3BSY3_9LAMI